MANRGWTWILAVAGAAASALVVVLALRLRDLTDEVRHLRFQRNLPQVGDVVPVQRVALLAGDSVDVGHPGPARRQVWFVFNTSCPICAASTADWNLAYERVATDSSVVVLGLALDSASATTTYVRERGMTFPVALLEDPLAHARYRFAGVPLTIVIDEVGRILLVRPGRFTGAAADSLLTFLSARGETAEVVAQR